MCVCWENILLTELETAQTVSVGAFLESAGGLNNVSIVDAMLAYNCERMNQVYLLVFKNILYIKSMDDNLIQPFILQEADPTVRKNWYRIYYMNGSNLSQAAFASSYLGTRYAAHPRSHPCKP